MSRDTTCPRCGGPCELNQQHTYSKHHVTTRDRYISTAPALIEAADRLGKACAKWSSSDDVDLTHWREYKEALADYLKLRPLRKGDDDGGT